METINTTPARYNNTNIEKTFAELKTLLDNTQSSTGRGLPGIFEKIREHGVDKIFFVGRDYHGKYEDDYCYFTYWNEVEKKFESDEWGTWAAFPHYDLYEMPLDFGTAWDNGLIDKEEYLKVIQGNHLNSLSSFTFPREKAMGYNLRVKVDGGRKWKGEGYLIDTEENSYRYATPMYRSRYYGGDKDFGVSTTVTAVIWDPISNTINRANAKYLQFLDEEEIMERYIFWAKNIILKATPNNIHSNNQYNLGRFILDVDYSFEKFMAEVWNVEHRFALGSHEDAYDAEMEEKKRKESEYRASKMPGIIEWVKANTDKKGEEIIALAVHIFNKNN